MIDNVLALTAANAVLIIIPGPNVALIVANSLGHGYRYGFETVLGTTLGDAVQLALVIIGGFAVLIDMAATALGWVRWLGIGYLVYLGVRTWLESEQDLGGVAPAADKAAFSRGLGPAVV